MVFLPDESRSLPPPPLVNKGSVWLGFTGWVAAMLDNSFNKRPVIRSGAAGLGGRWEWREGRAGSPEVRGWGGGCVGGFGVIVWDMEAGREEEVALR